MRETEQVVFGDILFFVNFCMDFQCLFLTARLLRRPFRLWRATLFSALGALYACVALFLSVSGVVAFLLDLFVCFLMCLGAFGKSGERGRRAILPFFVYFGTSFAVGGVMSGIGSLLSRADLPLGVDGVQLSTGAFFLLALLGGGLTFLWGKFCQRRAVGRRAELNVSFLGKTLTLQAMVDTANGLCEPLTGRLVALVAVGAIKPLLPPELQRMGSSDFAPECLPPQFSRYIRVIPAATATGGGILYALAPDKTELDAGRGKYEITLLMAPVSLCNADADCLLPAALLTE